MVRPRQVLASDELNGSLTGTPGFIRATEYVEGQFKAIDLRAGGVDGFRQPVGFRTITTDIDYSSLALLQFGKPAGP